MEYFSLILLHVAGGVIWAGGVIAAGLFIIPATLEAGPAGAAVLGGIMRRKFPMVMTGTALVVVLTGLRLYMSRATGGWLASAEGIGLSVGGLLGIGGFFIGAFIQKPLAQKLAALGARVAASGGPPSPEQAQELEALRARLGRVGRVTAWHLVGATLLMASHRLLTLL